MKSKRIFLVIILSISCAIVSNAQSSDDTLVNDEIGVNNYILGTSKSKLMPLFKKADSVSRYDELGDCTTTALYFKKSVINLCDTVLDGFDALDNSIYVTVKKKIFRVGDGDKEVKKMFPNSFSARSKEDPNRTFITVYLGDYVGLSFIINDKDKIIEILFWEDSD